MSLFLLFALPHYQLVCFYLVIVVIYFPSTFLFVNWEKLHGRVKMYFLLLFYILCVIYDHPPKSS